VIAEYYSMWSNTVDGGIVLFGVEDNGTVTGCGCLAQERLNRLDSFHVEMCPGASPEAKRIPVTVDGAADFVIAAYLPYRGTLVETQRGHAYIRYGDTKHQMTVEEKEDFRSTRHERSWEQRESEYEYPRDFSRAILIEYCTNFRERERKPDWTAEDILEDRQLLVRRGNEIRPLNALLLLAANNPRKTIPGCRVRVQRFSTLTEGAGNEFHPIRDVYLEGSIPVILEAAQTAITSLNYDVTWLGRDGKFVTTSEYPEWAWFEALVNACVHRSYSFSGSEITAKFFPDRLEIESPGGFVPPVNEKNIYTQRASRNPHLMDALRYLGYVRMSREGTKRMKESMERWNLPAPQFSQEMVHGVSVRVTLRNDHEVRKRSTDKDVAAYCGVDRWKQLAEHEITIVGYAFRNRRIHVAEAARLTGRAWSTSKKDLDRLVKKSLLTFIPPKKLRDPDAHYQILKNGFDR
jgi:ATP-dependent DNA helicase RecG